MKIKLAVAVGVIIAGCSAAMPRHNLGDSAVPASIPSTTVARAPERYTYDLLTPEETGLQTVFDDTQRTYLSFEEVVPAGLSMFDEQGRAVTFSAVGRTAVVEGVHAGILIRTPTHASYAAAPPALAGARSGQSESAVAWLPPDLAGARAEILEARSRLAQLSTLVEQAANGASSTSPAQISAELDGIQRIIDRVNGTVLRAHFASGSALLSLSLETKQALIAAASRADQVLIRGGADNTGPAAFNERLAANRAESMREVFIAGGITDVKLHITAWSGAYIATNSTAAGRAQNRHVDVAFKSRSGEASSITSSLSQP
jgi:outer membrane protein OmpA-like peptidoglycan-associated protein